MMRWNSWCKLLGSKLEAMVGTMLKVALFDYRVDYSKGNSETKGIDDGADQGHNHYAYTWC